MEKKVCVFLADGFEEVEGLTIVDVLRRAGIDTEMVSVAQTHMIHGAHGIDIRADKLFEEVDYDTVSMLVLPGGMPGTVNLEEHKGLKELIKTYDEQKKYIGAICAAPSILGKMGLLCGRQAVSYPAKEMELLGAQVLAEEVVVSDHIITSRGMGTAIAFSLKLVEVLVGKKEADEIGKAIVYKCSE